MKKQPELEQLVMKFVRWTAREGWEYNWKTDMYEYKPLLWRPRTFEEIIEIFNKQQNEQRDH